MPRRTRATPHHHKNGGALPLYEYSNPYTLLVLWRPELHPVALMQYHYYSSNDKEFVRIQSYTHNTADQYTYNKYMTLSRTKTTVQNPFNNECRYKTGS